MKFNIRNGSIHLDRGRKRLIVPADITDSRSNPRA